MRKYFYSLLARYISIYVRPHDALVEVDAVSTDFAKQFPSANSIRISEPFGTKMKIPSGGGNEAGLIDADYVLLNGVLHFKGDIQHYLKALHAKMLPMSRLIVIYYNNLYRPLFNVMSWLGIRAKTPEMNWLSHSDIANLLYLADFEVIRLEQKVLLPLYIPLLSSLINRYLAPLPLFRALCFANVLLARPIGQSLSRPVSVSVVIPARNEAGNIEQVILRTPAMGPSDELIFVEGGSSDDTWETILKVQRLYGATHRIIGVKQDGKGKGDAVRKGFALASNDILMILDADLTVPPEDLPKFLDPLVGGKGDFINGSRLVYPMEKKAMRFLNMVGNKFFATAFSFVLGQRFKDTLCGTKALSKMNYERLARNRPYFGEFDPFGDFDLLFGAARMGLRIIEVPITYKERTYGVTNISRWRHGAILLAMLLFAARRLKFV